MIAVSGYVAFKSRKLDSEFGDYVIDI